MSTLPKGPSSPKAVQLYQWVTHPIQFMQNCMKQYGDSFTVRFPKNPPYVFYSNPKAIKEIFTGSPDDLHAGEANAIVESLLGKNSLLLLDGERHLRERRLMMPPFHGERMKAYGEIIQDLTDQTIDRWPLEKNFSFYTEMQHITLEVILRAVFGLEDGERLVTLRDSLTRLIDQGSNSFLYTLSVLVPGEKIRRLFEIAVDPVDLGPFQKLNIGRFLPWRPLAKLGRTVDTILYDEIQAKRKTGRETREDILSMLIEAKDEEGNSMSDEELRDEMMTLLAAGHETTANTLAWTIHYLLSAPEEIFQKLLEEIYEVIGDGPFLPEYATKLPYLDASIKESMRMTPIIPIVARKLKRDMTIGGYHLPEGVFAIPCIYLTHHRPELWALPERYWPDRFLGDTRTNPYEFFPFGGGVRRCLGMAFALYEMKIVLARILHRVKFQKYSSTSTTLVRRGISFAPSNGIQVSIKSRKPR